MLVGVATDVQAKQISQITIITVLLTTIILL